MRLQQLQCILAVEKCRSISAAARELYMGQTTASASIRKLEEELGVVIFERSANGVEPTEEGEQVLELARQICRNYDEIREMGRSSRPDAVTVFVTSSVEAFLPEILADRFPETEQLSLRFLKKQYLAISNHVVNSECDLAVTHIRPEDMESLQKLTEKYDMQIKKLAADKLFLVVRPDHPLAGKDTMAVQDIQNMTIAGLQQYRDHTKSIAYEPRMGYTNRYTTLPSVRLVLQAVEEQNMAGILTGYAVHFENARRSQKLHPICLTDPHRSNELILCMMFRKTWAQTYAGKILLDCIQRSFADLMPDIHVQENKPEKEEPNQ